MKWNFWTTENNLPPLGAIQVTTVKTLAAAEQLHNTETIPAIPESTKTAWWQVFTSALYAGVDDSSDLLAARDLDHARKMAQGARNIADAALVEYEGRFGL